MGRQPAMRASATDSQNQTDQSFVILTIRTDKAEAEVGLFKNRQEIAYKKWPAHRQLTETIHKKIEELLQGQSLQQGLSLQDIEGIVCFRGPGSFTGLRIGLTVANALAYSLNIPIVSARGEKWIEQGVKRLRVGENEKITVPFYGRPANITKPKK